MGVSLFDVSVYMTKSAIVLLFVVLLFRVLGKRDIGQFNVFDLVTVIALSNAVQNAMTGGRGELALGLSCALSLLGVGYIMSRIYVSHPAAQRLMLGVPVLLLNDGQIMASRLSREHVSEEELMAALRSHGFNDPSEVGMAVLEVDGSISVVPKGQGDLTEKSLY